MRVTLNKSGSGRDAGLVFQDGYSTRALLGLLASDDLAIKVSPDGSAYMTALAIDRATGLLTHADGVVPRTLSVQSAGSVNASSSAPAPIRPIRPPTPSRPPSCAGPGAAHRHALAPDDGHRAALARPRAAPRRGRRRRIARHRAAGEPPERPVRSAMARPGPGRPLRRRPPSRPRCSGRAQRAGRVERAERHRHARDAGDQRARSSSTSRPAGPPPAPARPRSRCASSSSRR